MPHDRSGNELNIGDLVTLEARVRSISPGTANGCNTTLEIVAPPGAESEYVPTVTLNARMCGLIGAANGGGAASAASGVTTTTEAGTRAPAEGASGAGAGKMAGAAN